MTARQFKAALKEIYSNPPTEEVTVAGRTVVFELGEMFHEGSGCWAWYTVYPRDFTDEQETALRAWVDAVTNGHKLDDCDDDYPDQFRAAAQASQGAL